MSMLPILLIADATDADAVEDLVEILDKDKGRRDYLIMQQSANNNMTISMLLIAD